VRVAIVSGIAASTFVFYGYIKHRREEELKLEREENLWKNTRNDGMGIGRDDWTLINCATGNTVTKKDLSGKWVLMYFGFSHCPDICPETMEKVMDIVEIHNKAAESDKKKHEILPVFITIDPERDSPEILNYYLQDYPHFLGLTGSSKQIKEVCKNYKIYFSVGPKSDDGDYILDHSIVIYLINPDGVYQNHFMERTKPPEDIYQVMKQQFALYDKFSHHDWTWRNYF